MDAPARPSGRNGDGPRNTALLGGAEKGRGRKGTDPKGEDKPQPGAELRTDH
jgi:hypothetical protein